MACILMRQCHPWGAKDLIPYVYKAISVVFQGRGEIRK